MDALGRREGVRKPLDQRGIGQNHTDDIEAHALPRHGGAASVIAGRPAQISLLFGVDGTVGSAELGGRTRLHLDEDERVSLPDHQIDFPAPRTGPVSPRHDGASLPPQIPVRQVFPEAAVVSRPQTAAQGIARAIQPVDHVASLFLPAGELHLVPSAGSEGGGQGNRGIALSGGAGAGVDSAAVRGLAAVFFRPSSSGGPPPAGRILARRATRNLRTNSNEFRIAMPMFSRRRGRFYCKASNANSMTWPRTTASAMAAFRMVKAITSDRPRGRPSLTPGARPCSTVSRAL